jgi:predicted amidophosphoribosyltransferase
MNLVRCPSCGRDTPADVEHCAQCGASLSRSGTGWGPDAIRRFKWFLVVLVVLCALLILWLPRQLPG